MAKKIKIVEPPSAERPCLGCKHRVNYQGYQYSCDKVRREMVGVYPNKDGQPYFIENFPRACYVAKKA